MHDVHEVPSWVPIAPTVTGLSGILLAYIMYMFVPSIPGKLASAFRPIYLFLLNKWYFDELYDAIFVRPARALARVPVGRPAMRPSSTVCRTARRRSPARSPRARYACRRGVSRAMPSP